MALDLKTIRIGNGERGHGFAKFENREMVQRCLNVADLALRDGLRSRRGDRKSKGNRRERLHSGLLGRNNHR
jgi:signal recognition particle GTPase